MVTLLKFLVSGRHDSMFIKEIIKDKYAENLKTIEALDGVVRKLHSQAETKVRSLVAEIEMARKNNAIQAQFIAELEPNRDLVLSSAVHVMTRDIVLKESAGYDWDFSDIYETLLDPEPEKEITNLDDLFHFGDPQGENSLSIENESGGFSRKTSRDEAAACSSSEVIEDKGFR
ncbi:hypothetical protein TorRG33x02_164220 [Trema orientale]|uniref:Uncharacterized protein n=1 Tax=Trema orientale TaxID=63057 RepID=A0A2P5EQA1_TREOI|nr:hypothetical protein TorRG33x02_164220 [Trema orientale]